ncbi:hypothetical protein ABG067_005980 [Albugo candida]
MRILSFLNEARFGQPGKQLLRSEHRCYFMISYSGVNDFHRQRKLLFSSASPRVQVCEETNLAQNLDLIIANRDFVKALRFFERLPEHPNDTICQKLVIFLAKSETGSHVQSALEILRNSFRNARFKADDYTKLAFIYVVDGCLLCEETNLAQNLDLIIANRDFVKALRFFERLPEHPNDKISQKLVILLAKSETGSHVQSALEILRNSFRNARFKADDYTKLAFIYVVDGCLRHDMLKEAMEIYDEASQFGILLDLQAYSGILEALVQANMLEEAVDIIRELSAEKEVIPTERLYHPVLMALVKRCDYLVATDLLEHARVQNVEFSFDMYQQLLDVAGHQGEGSDAYESFMTYVEEALSENDTILDALFDEDGDADDGNDDEDEFD